MEIFPQVSVNCDSLGALWPRDLSWRDGGAAARLAHLRRVWQPLRNTDIIPYDILRYIDLFLGRVETSSASQLHSFKPVASTMVASGSRCTEYLRHFLLGTKPVR